MGDADGYPVKTKKTKIPEKHAVAYIYIFDGKIGIETREEKGMLGGMIGFPTSEWIGLDEKIDENYNAALQIRHVFTHFALTLYPQIIYQKTERMVDFRDVDDIGLPTLFKKLWNMIRSQL